MEKARHDNKKLLFLTGCINPAGMIYTKLQDPAIRKGQYIDAIHFYLNACTLPVLFVENSGSDISDAFPEALKTGRLEIITFNGNDYDKQLGKGYGEMLIIEKALQSSRLLQDASFVFKITGRYKLLNLHSYLQQHEQNAGIDLLVDLRQQLQYSDSRFWGSTPLFLNTILLKYKHQIDDSKGFFFEHALSCACHEAMAKGFRFSALRYHPRIDGVYGTDNRRYKTGLIFWLPQNLKHWLRYKMLCS